MTQVLTSVFQKFPTFIHLTNPIISDSTVIHDSTSGPNDIANTFVFLDTLTEP